MSILQLDLDRDVNHFNRVFLTGKSHVEYRKGLNLLFTRKALRCAYESYFHAHAIADYPVASTAASRTR